MPSFYKSALLSACATMLACVPLTASAQAQGVTVAHAKGETVVANVPTKVAVFDLATLDILNALEIEAVAGVPKGAGDAGNFSANLSKFADAKYQNVGTLFIPDEAALTALKPDLIFVAGRSASKFDAVNAIAPTIDMSSDKGLAETAVENTRKLGAIFGVTARANARIASFEAQIAQMRKLGAKQGTGLLLFAVGQGAVAHAPGDRFGTVYDFVGIRSSVPAAPPKPAVAAPREAAGSPEAAAAKAVRDEAFGVALKSEPNWLFVIDRTAISSTPETTIQERLGADPGITATKAWKAGRVIYLDPKAWYVVGAGIDALSGSAKQIEAAFKSAR